MDIVSILVTILVLAGIFALFWWGLKQIPLPAPAGTVINIVLAVVGIILLASLLTGGWNGIVIAR